MTAAVPVAHVPYVDAVQYTGGNGQAIAEWVEGFLTQYPDNVSQQLDDHSEAGGVLTLNFSRSGGLIHDSLTVATGDYVYRDGFIVAVIAAVYFDLRYRPVA